MVTALGACAMAMSFTAGHHLGGTQQGVAAPVHGRGAGMGFGARDGHLEPALPLGAGDDADGLFFRLQNRALFDMGLEEGADLAAAAFLLAEVADAFQFLAHGLAVQIGPAVAVVEIEHAGQRRPEATMAGAKREPSSLVQTAASMGGRQSSNS